MYEADWQQVDQLISEQKMAAALERVERLLDKARAAGDQSSWGRALVRGAQLRASLGGYEQAVGQLLTESWPQADPERSALDLFVGRSLLNYFHAYSWEIAQRERVAGDGEIDLATWTQEQIVTAAQRRYQKVWLRRQQWGDGPVGRMAEYLVSNDYPPRIRGTLRDVLTYLWVELLADASLWSPAAANGVFSLDRKILLAAAGSLPQATAKVAEPAPHPLLEVATILGDLEAWHAAAERPEAALEARLERHRRLRPHLDSQPDRQLLEADLRAALKRSGRHLPWWAVGQAELAELIRSGNAPDSLVQALEVARAGQQAHPQSPGGHRCANLMASLTAPSYQLEAMLSDGLDKRSMRLGHANLERLFFRAYALDMDRVLADARGTLLPRGERVRQWVAKRQPIHEWSVELPQSLDLRRHHTYVNPPFEEPGAYLVVASARADFEVKRNQLTAVQIFIGDLVLSTSTAERRTEVAVRSGASGEPVGGVEVGLYVMDWQRSPRLLAQQSSRRDGSLILPQPEMRGGGQLFLLARRGREVAFLDAYPRQHRGVGQQQRTDVLIYTDRSAYRPGQQLKWKVVAYGGNGEAGRFEVLPERTLQVVLRDANGEEIAQVEAETNSFGSAAGEFALPAGRLLGSWSLGTDLGGWVTLQVEEYKRPTFEVAIDDPPGALRLNREALLEGSARYYFGLPVSAGKVDWRVVREPVYPPWWRGWNPRPRGPAQTVAAGRAELSAAGRFEVRFLPQADEQGEDQALSYRYRLSAEVTDEGGETRSAERAFRLGLIAIEAQIEGPSPHFAGRSLALSVLRRDLERVPRAGSGEWRLLRLQQPEEALLPAEQPFTPTHGAAVEHWFHTPGDLLRPRWQPTYQPEAVLHGWPDGAELARGELNHDARGRAEIELGDLAPGAYRLRYSTLDAWGQRCEVARELVVVADRSTPLALPLLLGVDEGTVRVGQTLRVFAFSALDGLSLELEIARNGTLIERRRLRAGDDSAIVELSIDDSLRGGFSVTLRALRDHQMMTLSRQIAVPWDNRHLQLAFSTFRDRLRPGGAETWRLEVRRQDGQPVGAGEAEILAYMYDRSLDLFAQHRPHDPRSVYPVYGGGLGFRSSLGHASQVWNRAEGWIDLPPFPSFQGDRLKFFDSYPIGGFGRRGRQVMKVFGSSAMAQEGQEMAEAVVVSAQTPVVVQAEMADLSARPPAAPPPTAAPELRSDFSETAFWFPHLLTDEEGGVALQFTVPDSVTEWRVWAHALTREFSSGRAQAETRTVKDLLVRPYLPRFLRAGDQTAIEVVVNNAGDRPLAGELTFELFDPRTEVSLLEEFGLTAAQARRTFAVEPGAGSELRFALTVPPRIGPLAVRVMARAGALGDGEVRPLAVLPSRLHLTQSRFVALSGDAVERLEFADLARQDDPTRIDEQLVVTLDGQLFYGVLAALPYLVEYPYECVEQTLNRFLSTGIVATLFDQYPAISRLAENLAKRETRLEAWRQEDPNRQLLLEETPWRVAAAGGEAAAEGLIKVLDPVIARAQRDTSLAELERVQTAAGGFPWWPGGPPSPYITLYLLDGLARALEHDVEVPRQLVARAWRYVEQSYRLDRDERLAENLPWPTGAYLAYVLSSYPDASWTDGVFSDDDRRALLDHGFQHWRQAAPRLKAYLALALHRQGRQQDARLLFDSLMDSAKSDPRLGTYWAPEERSWLWYNDTIESHAFALRALMEIDPEDSRRHGLAQWLMLNKKLNHWKSTRATAEVVYALAHYLADEQSLAVREEAVVRIGSRRRRFVFEPDSYTGKGRQLVVEGAAIEPSMARIEVAKKTPGLMFASATWHFSSERLPETAVGDFFAVERRYFRRWHDGHEWLIEPLVAAAEIAVGDQLQVELVLRTQHAAEYVHLRDPRAAGFEPENPRSGYRWQTGVGYYEEPRDSATNFFFERLPVGEVVLRYRLRATHAGTFRVGPAEVQSMYAPEFAAYSAGARLRVSATGEATP